MPYRNLSVATVSRFSPMHALSALALALVISPAWAASECSPAEERQWLSARLYEQGSQVIHDGQWFQAREQHSGHEPGSGSFSWKPIAAPDCNALPVETVEPVDAVEAKPKDEEAPPVSKAESAARACEDVAEFSFGESYSPGALVMHQGELFRAMRPTTGSMPGMDMQPHWERFEQGCESGQEK